jgi:gamma-glutamyltranspeptidase/glutathione hydrolase
MADIPAAGLLSKTYASVRAALVDPNRASLERRPGNPRDFQGRAPLAPPPVAAGRYAASPSGDTTTITAIDREGNMFAATPSGAWFIGGAVIVPEIGMPLTKRLESASLDPSSPNALAPGKRPRVTLTPSLALRDGRPFLAFSSPGGDHQDQALLQVFLNIVEFGMNSQEAIEAPRVATDHLVGSFAGGTFTPGRLRAEDRLSAGTIAALQTRGHRVVVGGPWSDPTAPTAVMFQPEPLGIYAGADPRRDRHAFAW